MATLASLTLDVFEMLYGTAQMDRPAEDTLASAVSSNSDTTWRFSTPALWKRGDWAEYWPGTGTAGEVVILAQDHDSTADVLVRRAQARSSAASSFTAGNVFLRHAASGGSFTAMHVQRAINNTIDYDLAPNIWYRSKRTQAVTAGTTYYALTAGDFDVEEVYQRNLNSTTTHSPFPRGWWDVEHDKDTGMAASGSILRLYQWYDTSATVYYTAKTYPSSSAISSLPGDIAAMVPWGAVARLAPSQATRARHERRPQDPSQPFVDASYFESRFLRMRQQYQIKLLNEKPPLGNFRQRHPFAR